MQVNRARDYAWLCPIVSLLLAAATLLAFGLTWWNALILALLLGCVIAAAWALVFGRLPAEIASESVPETQGLTIEWMAAFYEPMCRLFGLGRAFREEMLRVSALQLGERVLDAGCGTGVWTRLAAKVVGPTGRCTGIDPGPRMIGIARLDASKENSSAKFKLAAVEQLPFGDGSFDVVMLSLVLHHLPSEAKRKGLEEIHRVLRPGGRLIVVDFDHPDSLHWRMVMRPLLPARIAADLVPGKVLAYLQGVGFDPVATDGRWRRLLTFWIAVKPVSPTARR